MVQLSVKFIVRLYEDTVYIIEGKIVEIDVHANPFMTAVFFLGPSIRDGESLK